MPNQEDIFDNLDALLERYMANDLPEDKTIFPYYATITEKAKGSFRWIHRDELKTQAILKSTYPGSYGKRQ